jgi:tetratricopeptide (TPR) repeat protein
MMKGLLSTILLAILSTAAFAQDYHLTDSVKKNLEQAKTAAEKIKWMGELAGFYMNLNNQLAEQYGKQQIEVAELSRDRELMLKAVLSNANRLYSNGGVQQNLVHAKKFSERALELAKTSHLDEYIAWSYIYLSRGARMEGNHDKALNYSNLANSLALTLDNDSLQISAFLSLGKVYQSRNEKLLSFRNYLQGMNLAEESNITDQIKTAYFSMADFYRDLEDYEKAKDYLFKVEEISKKENNKYELMYIYNTLGQIYTQDKNFDMARVFHEKAIVLSDEVKMEILKINAYFGILNQYLVSKQGGKALKYFNEKPELKNFMLSSGFDYFLNHAYGVAYTQLKKYDSAKYYFDKAEPGFLSRANKFNQFFFYQDYGALHFERRDYKNALSYYLKAKAIGEERKDLEILRDMSGKLDSVYQQLGDYKNAYANNAKYNLYKDSLNKLSTEKDLLLLEVENENKRKQREAELAEIATRERHNIQYMGITAAIAAVFILLVMLGIFSVSKTTIRILGFFAFIFLFEFIILLADHQIHHWTHGEPWKILAIKIGLISVLLPLHHYLEEKVIHYLTSRKLLEVKPKLFSRFSGSVEKVES